MFFTIHYRLAREVEQLVFEVKSIIHGYRNHTLSRVRINRQYFFFFKFSYDIDFIVFVGTSAGRVGTFLSVNVESRVIQRMRHSETFRASQMEIAMASKLRRACGRLNIKARSRCPVDQVRAIYTSKNTDIFTAKRNAIVVAITRLALVVEAEYIAIRLVDKQVIVDIEIRPFLLDHQIARWASATA